MMLSVPKPIPKCYAVCTRLYPDAPWEVVADECGSKRKAWPLYSCPDEATQVRDAFRRADPAGAYEVFASSAWFGPVEGLPILPPKKSVPKPSASGERRKKPPSRTMAEATAARIAYTTRAMHGEDVSALAAEFKITVDTVKRAVLEHKRNLSATAYEGATA